MDKLSICIPLVLASALVGCGSKKPSSETMPAQTAPADGTGSATMRGTISAEECAAQGGQVKGDIGDGKVACDEGQRDLGRVNQGIEGAVCCAPATPGGQP